VIERYRRSAFLDVELKVDGIGQKLARALETGDPGPGLVVSSFLPEVLVSVHDTNLSLPLGLICETHEQLQRWRELPIAFVIPHYRLLTPDRLAEFHSEGKRALVWTVNDTRSMKRFAAMGVDGIISDETQLLVQTLARQNSLPQL
jgi:glycerophosphoryl diester phosphodiesterase